MWNVSPKPRLATSYVVAPNFQGLQPKKQTLLSLAWGSLIYGDQHESCRVDMMIARAKLRATFCTNWACNPAVEVGVYFMRSTRNPCIQSCGAKKKNSARWHRRRGKTHVRNVYVHASVFYVIMYLCTPLASAMLLTLVFLHLYLFCWYLFFQGQHVDFQKHGPAHILSFCIFQAAALTAAGKKIAFWKPST